MCTKSFVGWGTGGAYSAPPSPVAVFRGPTFKGRERRREEVKKKGVEGSGKEGRGARNNIVQLRYNTIRDAILTCARKPTRVSLIYKPHGNRQLKSVKQKH